MKKFFFAAIIAVMLLFTACNAPTTFTMASGTVSEYSFNDFFNPTTLVHTSSDETSTAIIMDKNTGVLYIYRRSGYQFGISPIYDSDGTVLTMEKWKEKQASSK